MSELQALTKEIAGHLGGPWVYGGQGTYSWQAKIVQSNDAEICIKATGVSDYRRLFVAGIYPGNHLPFGTEHPRITVAVSRGAEAIAKDIERRFLPQYLPLFEQNMQAKADDEEFRRKETAARDSLAEALDGEIVFDHSIRFAGPDNSYGTMTVGGDTVTVELRSLGVESAKRLAHFLLIDRSKAAAMTANRRES